MTRRIVATVTGLLVLASAAACGSGQAAEVGPTSALTTTTSAAAATTLTTATPTSSSKKLTRQETLSALCAVFCADIQAVEDLPACSTGADCNAQIRQAEAVLENFRQNLIDNNIDRQDFIDLDDALTNAQQAVREFNRARCISAPKGSTELFTCATQTLTVKFAMGTVALTLGANP